MIDYAIAIGIPYLTFWAFSTENWKRNKREVNFLMKMFRNDLEKRVDAFHQKNVRLNIIGNLSLFPKDIQEKTAYWMNKTKNNKTITVNVALSYGGRDEIMRAVDKWRESSNIKAQMSKSDNRQLTTDNFNTFLDTAGQPDPDLLIRTGGEMRLSGFMLWQIAYTELYFTKTLWPDFTPKEFEKALLDYQKRQRRFGR